MSTSSASTKNRIFAKLEFIELLKSDGIDFKSPSGDEWKGDSPFTTPSAPGKSASLSVNAKTTLWQDHRDDTYAGDAFNYVMFRDNVDFSTALRTLAKLTGVPVKGVDFELEEQRRKDLELLDRAVAHYQNCLSDSHRKILLENWNIKDVSIKKFRIGVNDSTIHKALPDEIEHLKELKLLYENKEQDAFGGVKTTYSSAYDKRFVFPYLVNGVPEYTIARDLTEFHTKIKHDKKYKKLTTSKTIKNVIFNTDVVTSDLSELWITEGVTDCISADQAGIPCISPVTIRFSARELPQLIEYAKRIKGPVYICNDNDVNDKGETPGKDGAISTAKAMHIEGIDIRIGELPRPDGLMKVDLCDYLKDHTKEEFYAEVRGKAKNYVEFILDLVPVDTPKEKLSEALKDTLAAVKLLDAGAQDAMVDKIKARLKNANKTLVRKLLSSTKKEKVKETRQPAVNQDFENVSEFTFYGEVREGSTFYYLEKNGKEGAVVEQLSTFVLKATSRIMVPGDDIVMANAVMNNRIIKNIPFRLTAWNGLAHFRNALPSPDLVFSGKPEHVQGVQRRVARQDVPVSRGVSVLGYADTDHGPKWVSPKQGNIGTFEPETSDPWKTANKEYKAFETDFTGVINKTRKAGYTEPFAPQHRKDTVYVADGTQMEKRVLYTWRPPEEVRELAQAVLPDLFKVNEPTVMLPLIGWFFATFFKPRLVKIRKNFPSLCCWGTMGTGKTSTVRDILWPLHGIKKDNGTLFSAISSPFAQIALLSSTSSIPVCLDEYRPSSMPKNKLQQLHRNLRSIYGEETDSKGQADLSTRDKKLQAPVVLVGEARPENDPALEDRFISVQPAAGYFDDHPESTEAYARLVQRPLQDLAVPFIQFALAQDTREDYAVVVAEADPIIDKLNSTPRCRKNLHAVAFGLRMLQRFAKEFGVDEEGKDIVELPEFDLKDAFISTTEDLMDGEHGSKSGLDDFVEICSTLAHIGGDDSNRGGIIDRLHYHHYDGFLFLHINSCWEAYRGHMQRTGQTPSVESKKVLRRLIRENHKLYEKTKDGEKPQGYIAETKHQIPMKNETNPRCVAIDMQRVHTVLDITGFPATLYLTNDEAAPPSNPMRKMKGVHGAE